MLLLDKDVVGPLMQERLGMPGVWEEFAKVWRECDKLWKTLFHVWLALAFSFLLLGLHIVFLHVLAGE
jgi:hypothetical protein